MKRTGATLILILAMSLAAGCTGYAHWGMTHDDERAITRSDSACDTAGRTPGRGDTCYLPPAAKN